MKHLRMVQTPRPCRQGRGYGVDLYRAVALSLLACEACAPSGYMEYARAKKRRGLIG